MGRSFTTEKNIEHNPSMRKVFNSIVEILILKLQKFSPKEYYKEEYDNVDNVNNLMTNEDVCLSDIRTLPYLIGYNASVSFILCDYLLSLSSINEAVGGYVVCLVALGLSLFCCLLSIIIKLHSVSIYTRKNINEFVKLFLDKIDTNVTTYYNYKKYGNIDIHCSNQQISHNDTSNSKQTLIHNIIYYNHTVRYIESMFVIRHFFLGKVYGFTVFTTVIVSLMLLVVILNALFTIL